MTKRGPRKRRTRGYVIADLAVNHVKRHVLRCGHTMQRVAHDYGLDNFVTTYGRTGRVENGLFWIQVKATDRPRWLGEKLAVRVERKDLLFWIGEKYPVMLVIYDAGTEQAFWLHIQKEFQKGKIFGLERQRTSMTVHVPHVQTLNQEAIELFRKMKRQASLRWRKRANHG